MAVERRRPPWISDTQASKERQRAVISKPVRSITFEEPWIEPKICHLSPLPSSTWQLEKASQIPPFRRSFPSQDKPKEGQRKSENNGGEKPDSSLVESENNRNVFLLSERRTGGESVNPDSARRIETEEFSRETETHKNCQTWDCNGTHMEPRMDSGNNGDIDKSFSEFQKVWKESIKRRDKEKVWSLWEEWTGKRKEGLDPTNLNENLDLEKVNNGAVFPLPDQETFKTVIQLLIKGGMLEEADLVMKKMVEENFLPPVRIWCALASAKARAGQSGQPRKTLEEMKKLGVKADMVAWGLLIESLGREGNAGAVKNALKEMEESGEKMNSIIATSVIKMYGKLGKVDEAEKFFEFVKEKVGFLDTMAWNTMLEVYGKAGQSKIFKATRMFRTMRAKRNSVTYCLMIRIYMEAGRFGQASQIANELRNSEVLNDVASFNCLIGLYNTLGRSEESVKVHEEMKAKGLKPDSSTRNRMGSMLLRAGRLPEALSQFQENGAPLSPQSATTLISVHSQAGRHVAADKIWCQLESPDLPACNAMILAYGRAGRLDKAVRLFGSLSDYGLQPDVVTYTSLISVYGAAGLVDGVTRVMQRMKVAGVRPTASTFEAAMRSYRRSGRGELASMLRQEWELARFLAEQKKSTL